MNKRTTSNVGLQKQGELTVSSKPEAAFAIAAVIVALWVEFPDFGRLLLAHFHQKCPYLVPAFMPQVEGQTDEDYFRYALMKVSMILVEINEGKRHLQFCFSKFLHSSSSLYAYLFYFQFSLYVLLAYNFDLFISSLSIIFRKYINIILFQIY